MLRVAALTLLLLLQTACALQGLTAQAPPLPAQARTEPQSFLVVTVRNQPQSGAVRAGSTPRGYDTAVQYGVAASAAEAVHGLEHDYGLREVSAWPITTLNVHCVMFQLSSQSTRAALLTRLAQDPRVESVQPLNAFDAQAAPEGPAQAQPVAAGAASWMPYNDPYAHLQHSLRELAVVDAQRQTRGAGIRIAVIDTGVDLRHPDLKGRIFGHRNFVDDDEVQFDADRHGTEVAGVIAAVADNGVGIVGIAPEARLLVLKACWQSEPTTASALCNSFTLAQALEAAIVAHVDVVNMSLAGPADPLLERLIRGGIRDGIIFVGAAAPPGRSGFPADLAPVLPVAVAEAGADGRRYLSAPGRDVLTLVPGGHYDFASGSSLAAAEVTGIVALLLADHPHLRPQELREFLERSSNRVDTPAGPAVSINACTALGLVQARETCTAAESVAAGHTAAER